MSRKAVTVVISAVVVVGVLFSLTYFVVFPLAAQGKLPFQPHPTRLPVTPFAGLSTPAAAATTISAVPTTAAATATVAPAATPTTGATAAVTAPPAGTTAAATAVPATATTAAASAPSGTTAAAIGSATTYPIVADQSKAQVTVSEKFATCPPTRTRC